jgi:DNA-binding beta-propeller fold protein YncE
MLRVRRIAAPSIALLAVVDLALALGVIHREWFSSLKWGAFLWLAWDAISLWSGRAVTIAGVLIPAAVYLFKKRWPAEHTWKESFAIVSSRVAAWSARARVAFTAFGVLLLIAAGMTFVLLTVQPRFAASASPVLMTPDGSEIYVITQASQQAGKILRIDATTGKNTLGVIDVGGTPDRMLAGPRSGHVYVLDVQRALVTVIDSSRSIVEVIPSQGKVSTSIALTPDERKLYISNQQPSPLATITVVNLAQKGHPAHPIGGFNCPMGLGMLPDGSRLYVASQCGGGHDPVFVVDTTTDRIVTSLQDFATGSEIAVAGKELRVYVSRSSYARRDPSGAFVAEPPRISVIDPARDQPVSAETIDGDGSALTVSSDGQYLFFSTSTAVEILNTGTRKRSRIDFVGGASGIAVGRPDLNSASLALYAWLPGPGYLFFTGLNGLLP